VRAVLQHSALIGQPKLRSISALRVCVHASEKRRGEEGESADLNPPFDSFTYPSIPPRSPFFQEFATRRARAMLVRCNRCERRPRVEGEERKWRRLTVARARVEEARREGEDFQLDGANSDPEFILSISARWSGKELGAAALGLVVRYINAAELAASSPSAETLAETPARPARLSPFSPFDV